MVFFRRAMALLALVTLAMGVSAASADVEFTDLSYDDALAAAKAEGKYVFIDFYTTWCGPCKTLDEVTYADAKVVEFLSDVICVKLDAEKGVGIDLASEYRVKNYPTLVLIGVDGKEIDRHIGYLDPPEFIQVLTDYQNDINTVAFFDRKVKADANDAASWQQLGVKHAYAGRYDQAKTALNRYLELSPNLAGKEKAEIVSNLAYVYYRSESYEDAERVYQTILDEFADTDYYDQALTYLARIYHKLGNEQKCVESYMSYVNRHPNDPGAMNSFAWFAASNKVGLDAALPVALKAVEISNRDAGILDTLAELYYARGEHDKAIEIGKEALQSDPDDTYFNDQIKKFKKAKEEADKQARK